MTEDNIAERMFLLAKAMTILPIVWIFCFYLPGLSNPANHLAWLSLVVIAFDVIAVAFWCYFIVLINVATHGDGGVKRAFLALVLCLTSALVMCGLLILQYSQVEFLQPVSLFFEKYNIAVSIAVFIFSFLFVEWANKIGKE